MNRSDTIRVLREIGENIAQELGLSHVEVGNIDCGLWDTGNYRMSDILKEEYGEMETITFHGEEVFNNRWANTVEIGYRFSAPRIVVRCRREDNLEWLASLECSSLVYEGNEFVGTDDYRFSESQVWREEGIQMFKRIHDMWRERGGE